MFSFGPWEWLLVGLVALLLFGPGLVVRAAGTLGKGIREFRSSLGARDEDPPGPRSGG